MHTKMDDHDMEVDEAAWVLLGDMCLLENSYGKGIGDLGTYLYV